LKLEVARLEVGRMRGTYDVSDLELLSGGRHDELNKTGRC
jgi:hypothetical protein